MRLAALLLLCSSLAFGVGNECGLPHIKHNVTLAEIKGGLPSVDAEHALVIVIRNPSFKWLPQTKIAVDDEWAAVLKHKTFAAIYIAPGKHRICSFSKGWEDSSLTLNVEAGKLYFLEQRLEVHASFLNPQQQHRLELMQPENGEALMQATYRATMSLKTQRRYQREVRSDDSN